MYLSMLDGHLHKQNQLFQAKYTTFFPLFSPFFYFLCCSGLRKHEKSCSKPFQAIEISIQHNGTSWYIIVLKFNIGRLILSTSRLIIFQNLGRLNTNNIHIYYRVLQVDNESMRKASIYEESFNMSRQGKKTDRAARKLQVETDTSLVKILGQKSMQGIVPMSQ